MRGNKKDKITNKYIGEKSLTTENNWQDDSAEKYEYRRYLKAFCVVFTILQLY